MNYLLCFIFLNLIRRGHARPQAAEAGRQRMVLLFFIGSYFVFVVADMSESLSDFTDISVVDGECISVEYVVLSFLFYSTFPKFS